MYTQCPECLSVFSLDAQTLAKAHGHVVCGHCNASFGSLATLTEQLPPEPFVELAVNEPALEPPLLDLVVLFLGLPLVLRRDARKIFVTAGMSMTLVGTYYAVTLFCRALGNNYLLSPALAAWAPLLAFGPVAFVSARPLWD